MKRKRKLTPTQLANIKSFIKELEFELELRHWADEFEAAYKRLPKEATDGWLLLYGFFNRYGHLKDTKP